MFFLRHLVSKAIISANARRNYHHPLSIKLLSFVITKNGLRRKLFIAKKGVLFTPVLWQEMDIIPTEPISYLTHQTPNQEIHQLMCSSTSGLCFDKTQNVCQVFSTICQKSSSTRLKTMRTYLLLLLLFWRERVEFFLSSENCF